MNSCDQTNQGSPTLKLHMTGRGEDAMRMEKRLRCAGRTLGVDVQVEWEASMFGAPSVTVANRLLTDRLVSTEELESLLREYLKLEEQCS